MQPNQLDTESLPVTPTSSLQTHRQVRQPTPSGPNASEGGFLPPRSSETSFHVRPRRQPFTFAPFNSPLLVHEDFSRRQRDQPSPVQNA